MAGGLRLEIEPGQGNLNAKAYVAAVLGPYRLAHAQQRALNLTSGNPQKVASNPGVAGTDQAMFVGVALQKGSLPVTVLFGSSDMLGVSSNVPAKMDETVGGIAGVSFCQVLLPGEELWVVSDVDTNLVAFSVGF